MRNGFTTGSCAAAAAKAAAYMLLTGEAVSEISVMTPAGEEYRPDIIDVSRDGDALTCGVVKDGGDDPDVTTGATIYATVTKKDAHDITIDGGEGVGRVTKPGLDQPVGAAAINSVPRQMIEEAIREVFELSGYPGGADVIISVKGGSELSKKTFNRELGIVGGISIIGTTGIVEPMSAQALRSTIRISFRQQVALGHRNVIMVPGNYGRDFTEKTLGISEERQVKCSNFIGDAIDMAADEGVEKLLLAGHMGKLIKLCGGIMNTHSREADCRMELAASIAILSGADADTARKILSCVTTEEAFDIVTDAGIEEDFVRIMMDRIDKNVKKRAGGRLVTETMVFLSKKGAIGMTGGASSLLSEIKNEG